MGDQPSATSVPSLEFWFEFASTYSYPAAMVIEDRAKVAGVRVVWRPFLLGPVFAAFGWNDSPFNLHPAKGTYMWRDMERICERLNLPFQRPDRFPQNSVIAARMALAACDHPWGPAFCRAVYLASFAHGMALTDQEALLALAGPVGGDQAVLAAASSPDEKPRLRAQVEQAQRNGIFGAPSFRVGEELFWGIDRLDMALDQACRCDTAPEPPGIDR